MHTFKAKTKVWLWGSTNYHVEILKNTNSLTGLSLQSINMSESGYVHVGDAVVYVTIFATPEDVVAANVATLRKQLQEKRAEARREQNELIDQINKLEALTYEPSAI